jgi:predicted permease
MLDEFSFHREARTEDLMRSGYSREEAERRASIEFGGNEHYREECRESHRLHWLDEMGRDARYAIRHVRGNPGFSTLAIVSLAIGLGAVGLMFAVTDTVLLRPLPFAQSERIVSISQRIPILGSSPSVVTAEEFQHWQKSGLFESAAIIDMAEYTIEKNHRPERIYGASVTPEFFRVFQVRPVKGRSFTEGDAREASSNVIVLSDALWTRDFGKDPAVIGETIRLSGTPFTVIGVMPPGFDFPRLADVSQLMNWAPEHTEFWTPFVIGPKVIEAGNFNYYALGRLRPQVTPALASAQLLPIAVHLFKREETKYPQYRTVIEQMLRSFSVYVVPLRDSMSGSVRDALWMLLAAVALLLLLVLVNLGSLLLARNAQRLREYTVRLALGASRWQLFRQGFFEQAALTAAASLLAAGFIAWAEAILRSAAVDKVPRLHELRFSMTEGALLFSVAFATAFVFGALPQLLISGGALPLGWKEQGRTATGDRRTSRYRSLLIAAELSISVVLLVASGLLLESFENVLKQPTGYDTHNMLAVDVPFNPKNIQKPEDGVRHIRELIARLDALPGVVSASVINHLPLTGDMDIRTIQVFGKPFARKAESISAEYRVIDPDYFRTTRIPLISGREFRADDPANFAIINRIMAERLWPGESALGQRFSNGDNPALTVVGVVGDVYYGSLEKPLMMQYYQLFTANPYLQTFVLRTAYDPQRLVPLVQKAIWSVDASEPVTRVRTMDELLRAATSQRRFETWLLGAFAGLALFLSALGLFAVTSLSAARRTREFGIRIAVGASSYQIVGLELRRTVVTLGFALATGLMTAAAVARMMSSLLYRVTPWNLEIFGVATFVLALTALLAAAGPAIRAARIDPAAALRAE